MNLFVANPVLLYPWNANSGSWDQIRIAHQIVSDKQFAGYNAFPLQSNLLQVQLQKEYDEMIDMLFTEQFKRLQLMRIDAIMKGLSQFSYTLTKFGEGGLGNFDWFWVNSYDFFKAHNATSRQEANQYLEFEEMELFMK